MLQSRRYSQLELARSLPWLAAFGFLHALNEWGDLFIPLQRTYLSEAGQAVLAVIQLLLLVGSFACLFEFGVVLLRPEGRMRALHTVPALLLIGWILLSFFVLLPLSPDLSTWYRESNAASRYFICLPAGLLAAYGLRQQAGRHFSGLDAPHISHMLRITGGSLGVYALLAGLIPPPIPIPPGNWLNTVAFDALFGVSPFIFRAAIGLVLSVAIIRVLKIFDLETEHFIESMEQQQVLVTERDRIARELHDGVIQKVYTAGLLIDSAAKMANGNRSLENRLEKATLVLGDAIVDLRRNLGELRAAPSGLDLAEALCQLGQDPRFQSLLDVSLDVKLPQQDPLTASRADNVLAIVQEALSNTVRHARAQHVKIQAERIGDRLVVKVKDDGVGFQDAPVAGYGLRNMQDRARLLGGELKFESARNRGTTVLLEIPWRDSR